MVYVAFFLTVSSHLNTDPYRSLQQIAIKISSLENFRIIIHLLKGFPRY